MTKLAWIARDIAESATKPHNSIMVIIGWWNSEAYKVGRKDLQLDYVYTRKAVLARDLLGLAERLDSEAQPVPSDAQRLADYCRFPVDFCQRELDAEDGEYFTTRRRLMGYVHTLALDMNRMFDTGKPTDILDKECREWCLDARERWMPRRKAIREAACGYKDVFIAFHNVCDAYDTFTHTCIGFLNMMDEAHALNNMTIQTLLRDPDVSREMNAIINNNGEVGTRSDALIFMVDVARKGIARQPLSDEEFRFLCSRPWLEGFMNAVSNALGYEVKK